jgi:hypothetical protein
MTPRLELISRQSGFGPLAVPTHLEPGEPDDGDGNESHPSHMTSQGLTLLTKEQRPCHGDGRGSGQIECNHGRAAQFSFAQLRNW